MRNLNFMIIISVLFISCQKKETIVDHSKHQATDAKSVELNYVDQVNAGLLKDSIKKSLPRTVMTTINGNHIHIEYSSPGVRDRIIWGGLVPYDQIWSTGAHNATAIRFDKDVRIAGNTIEAGKYAFFTIPTKEAWTIIINTRYDQHLTDDYMQSEDVFRTEIQPIWTDSIIQRLTYDVNQLSDNTGEIVVRWEKMKLKIPFVSE